jgi:hypothetical protein
LRGDWELHSNDSAPSVATADKDKGKAGKRKSPSYADFEEIFETVNGENVCTKATYKM